MVFLSILRFSSRILPERTLIAVKPDGVQRGLVGDVISRFEHRGFKLVGLKLLSPPRRLLEVHYEEHKDKKHFSDLISYMSMGPVVAMVWEGADVVQQGRRMLGATDPLAADVGTIRGDFGLQKGRNVCHGSATVEDAEKEINNWFKKDEVIDYDNTTINTWIYEN